MCESPVTQWRRAEHGGMSILVMGILVGAAFLILLLATVGGGFVAHAELQQAVDVAGASIELGADRPAERARAIARANGAQRVRVDMLSGGTQIRIRVSRRAPGVIGVAPGLVVHAEAIIDVPQAATGDGGPNPPGQYSGPLMYVDGGIPICPRVGTAFHAMQSDAAGDGITIRATSGFRTFAEQAALYAQLGPAIAAPPGVSRHHDATEFDLNVGPAGSPIHRWLQAHGPAHGFIQRYSWEYRATLIPLPILEIPLPARTANLRDA
jgi:hypothetical protein